jgi:hypothetical protein
MCVELTPAGTVQPAVAPVSENVDEHVPPAQTGDEPAANADPLLRTPTATRTADIASASRTILPRTPDTEDAAR